MNDFDEKVSKLRQLMVDKQLDSIVLRRNPNLAWLISGRVHVPSNIEVACFDFVLTADDCFAVTNAIEAPRLAAEEFPEGLKISVIQWWQGRDSFLPTGPMSGCDQPGAERVDLSLDIEIMRQQLSSLDIARFEIICKDAAVALGEALKESRMDDREIDIAGRITKRLWEKNLDIAFLGVAGFERVFKFRHPLPTDLVVGERIVASICARQKGLIASVTRIVNFGEISTSALNEYQSLLQVEAAIIDATSVGANFGGPIAAAQASYPLNGFAADEWVNHHQGGPTGFLPRDWPATPDNAREILLNQAIAWNPTGKGWKVEDTLITEAQGTRFLTNDSTWPTVAINGRPRPQILRR